MPRLIFCLYLLYSFETVAGENLSMKILITSDLFLPSINGVVTSILNLKRELEKRGHEVRVLTLSENGKSYIEKDVYYASSLPFDVIYKGVRIMLGKPRKILKDIYAWHPDLIHTQSEFSSYMLAKKIAGKLDIPIVHTLHTIYEDYTHYFSPSRTLGRALARRLVIFGTKKASAIIAPTKKVEDIIIDYGIKKKTYIIPSGIDTDAFTTPISDETRRGLRRRFAIPEDALVLLFLGRLGKEKNIEEIISAFRPFQNENVYLLIAGDGPARKELEEMTKGMSHIIFTGMIEPGNVPQFYKMADIFLNASKSETQGLTFIEALSSALPVLCRKDQAVDGVIRDGVDGWQCDSTEDFKARLDSFIHDFSVRENIRKSVKNEAERFSASRFAKDVERVYNDILERR